MDRQTPCGTGRTDAQGGGWTLKAGTEPVEILLTGSAILKNNALTLIKGIRFDMSRSKFKDWVNSEVAKELDKDGFFSLPLKMRIGIFILLFSFLIGHGSTFFMVILPGIAKKLTVGGVLGGSSIYIVCWFLGAIGLSLAGRDSIKYPIYFFAKLLKVLFPRYFIKED
jgi:hypothetical protein